MNCLKKYRNQLLPLTTTYLQCISKALYASDFLSVSVGEEGDDPTAIDETKATALLEMVEEKVKTTEAFFTFIGILTSTGEREVVCFAEKTGKEYWSLSLERSHSQLVEITVPADSLSSYQMESPSDFVVEPQSNLTSEDPASKEDTLQDIPINSEMINSSEVRNKPVQYFCASSGELDVTTSTTELGSHHLHQPQLNEEPHCGEMVLPSLEAGFKEESRKKLVDLYASVSKSLSRRKTLRKQNQKDGAESIMRNQEDEQEIDTTSNEIEGIENHYKTQYELIKKELKLADIAHKSEREYTEKKHKRTVMDILVKQDCEMRGKLNNEEELKVLCIEHEELKKQLNEIKGKISSICKRIEEKKKELTLKRLVQRKKYIEVFLDDLKTMKHYITKLRDAWNKSLSEEKIDGYLAAIKDRVAIIKERRNSRSWPRN